MLRSTIIVSIFALIGSGLSFVNQLIIARVLGAGSELDRYLIAISLPLTIGGLLTGMLGYQIVPALNRLDSKSESFDDSWRGMIILLGGIATILAAAGIVSSPWLLSRIDSARNADGFNQAIEISVIAWSWTPLAIIASVVSGGLHVRQKFTVAAMLQPLPTLGTIIGCWFVAKGHALHALAWGQFVGYALLVIFLGISSGLKPGIANWVQARNLVVNSPLAMASLLIFIIYPFSDAIWGGRVGTAGVSLLGYAQRIVIGISGVFVVGVTTVIFPRLSKHAENGVHTNMQRDIALSLRSMLAFIAPVAAVLSVLASPLVNALFVRGAFQATDAAALASLLPWMFAGMVAMSAQGLAFKALFAQGRLREAAYLSAGGAVVYFTLSGFLPLVFGLNGIGASYAISWWLILIFTLRVLKVHGIVGNSFPLRVVGVITQCAGMAYAGRLFCFPDGLVQYSQFPALIGIMVSTTAIYFVGCLLWPGLEEVRTIARKLRAFYAV